MVRKDATAYMVTPLSAVNIFRAFWMWSSSVHVDSRPTLCLFGHFEACPSAKTRKLLYESDESQNLSKKSDHVAPLWNNLTDELICLRCCCWKHNYTWSHTWQLNACVFGRNLCLYNEVVERKVKVIFDLITSHISYILIILLYQVICEFLNIFIRIKYFPLTGWHSLNLISWFPTLNEVHEVVKKNNPWDLRTNRSSNFKPLPCASYSINWCPVQFK